MTFKIMQRNKSSCFSFSLETTFYTHILWYKSFITLTSIEKIQPQLNGLIETLSMELKSVMSSKLQISLSCIYNSVKGHLNLRNPTEFYIYSIPPHPFFFSVLFFQHRAVEKGSVKFTIVYKCFIFKWVHLHGCIIYLSE